LLLLLLSGFLLIALDSVLVYDYQVTEYYGETVDGFEWAPRNTIYLVYGLTPVLRNISYGFGMANRIIISDFEINPGPLSIVVFGNGEVILNHSIVSENIVEGVQYPLGGPNPNVSASFFSITINYEGVNSTISFSYTLVDVNHYVTIIDNSRIVDRSLNWSGAVGCVLIAISIIALVKLLRTEPIVVS
jgi:hypothetical protein